MTKVLTGLAILLAISGCEAPDHVPSAGGEWSSEDSVYFDLLSTFPDNDAALVLVTDSTVADVGSRDPLGLEGKPSDFVTDSPPGLVSDFRGKLMGASIR